MSAETYVLHSYYRSSAAWRVRIALNLKGVAHRIVAHHLRRGEQSAPDYLALNPQGLVPKPRRAKSTTPASVSAPHASPFSLR